MTNNLLHVFALQRQPSQGGLGQSERGFGTLASHAGTPYCIFVVSCFVAFVIDMLVLFLQIELDPIVKTYDLLPVLGFPHKHVLKSTGILPVKQPYCYVLQIISFPLISQFFIFRWKRIKANV